MSSVLLLAILAAAFVVLLKITDMLRDLSFEQRQTRAAVEHLIATFDEFNRGLPASAQRDLAGPSSGKFSNSPLPVLDEILEA